MILEFDAGNTRIKWRLRNPDAAAGEQVVARGSVFAQEKTPSVFLELCSQFATLPVPSIKQVLVANVRGEGFKTAFSALLCEKWQLQPTFVTVATMSALITHGYEDPARLGVDRWLAMQAAYASFGQSCVVLDFGTTITVDVVSAQGVHEGGYIVPGLELMKASLMARSKALVIPDLPWGERRPGLNTSEAIHHGILAMATGFVRDLHARMQGGAQAPVWVLTGGDAATFKAHFDWETTLAPDLVLDGLQYCHAS